MSGPGTVYQDHLNRCKQILIDHDWVDYGIYLQSPYYPHHYYAVPMAWCIHSKNEGLPMEKQEK